MKQYYEVKVYTNRIVVQTTIRISITFKTYIKNFENIAGLLNC